MKPTFTIVRDNIGGRDESDVAYRVLVYFTADWANLDIFCYSTRAKAEQRMTELQQLADKLSA